MVFCKDIQSDASTSARRVPGLGILGESGESGQPLKVEYDGNGGIYVFVEGWRGDQEY